jgi:hypothetical protein
VRGDDLDSSLDVAVRFLLRGQVVLSQAEHDVFWRHTRKKRRQKPISFSSLQSVFEYMPELNCN